MASRSLRPCISRQATAVDEPRGKGREQRGKVRRIVLGGRTFIQGRGVNLV